MRCPSCVARYNSTAMPRCPLCSAELQDDARFCPNCGAAVQPDASDLTVTAASPEIVVGSRKASGSSSTSASSTSTPHGGRFLPGTVLADRYRIYGLIGKGGMGEVYRADDLKLGQPVALKFLPEELCNENMLDRFYNEVRMARQVSHPNVCRVYDIFDWQGHHFLSMEFVDGEDLASLLRRIGRLPKDKAVDIARQLCASLAAAHKNGVLHRDLKPANIMIDGRGQVRITDFGLAGLAKEFAGAEIKAGTPSYMSPEQIAGTEVTVRSDIYALGLVLYELFTGKRAFKADTVAEVTRMHQSHAPTQPSQLVEDFDPLIERIILRCLEKDPADRPNSAMAVAAALPGGDPLAAALAAGETPSPEMVAASGGTGSLKPAVGIACLVFIAAGVIGVTQLQPRIQLQHWAELEKPAVVLQDAARGILESLGYTDEPFDRAGGYGIDRTYVWQLQNASNAPDRWAPLRTGQPPIIIYWYRESSGALMPQRPWGNVTFSDPAHLAAGMARVLIDSKGRLKNLHAVPDYTLPDGDEPPPDWSAAFRAAGLDYDKFEPTRGKFAPPVHCDATMAWEGVYPDNPDVSVVVQAGARGGKIVYFDILGDWQETSTSGPPSFGAVDILRVSIQLSVLVGSIILARRNLRLGRGDRRGAFRLALFLVTAQMLVWLCYAHHGATPAREWHILNRAIAESLWVGAFAWLIYLSIEPHIRRIQPRTIISWTRLLSGKLRDPVIGRDILLGGCVGVSMTLFQYTQWLAAGWLNHPPPQPEAPIFGAFNGVVRFFGAVLQQLTDAIYMPMIFVLVMMLLRLVLRLKWLSMLVFAALFIYLYPGKTESGIEYVDLGFRAVFAILAITLLLRFGVLALMFAMLINDLTFDFPLTFDFSLWYAWASAVMMALIAALCAYGFYTSIAGQRIFKESLLDA